MRFFRRGSGTITAVLMLALTVSAPSPGAEIAVQIFGGGPTGEVTVQARTPSGSTVSTLVELAESREALLRLEGGHEWTVSADLEGHWSAPRRAVAGEHLLRLELWPVAILELELETAVSGLPLPEALELRLISAEGVREALDQPGEAEVTCAVDPAGKTLCETPAGTWDIRAKAPSFVPHFLRAVRCPAGERIALGRVVLREGTSIRGQVATERGFIDPLLAEVVIEPTVEVDAGPVGTPSDLARMRTALEVDEWGYFDSGALHPGAYRIIARQPGFTDAIATVVLETDRDTELVEPLVLRGPLRLTLVLDPALDPSGRPWRLELLSSRRGDLRAVAAGFVDDAGTWTSRPLPPGLYTTRVLDERGRSYAWAEVELSREYSEHAIQIDLVRVEGEALVGDEPLQASLWFGGRRGTVSVEAESDAEGRFEVTLPRPGAWEVDISGHDRPVEVGRVEVDVPAPRGGRPVKVVVELPDTVLQGLVVDAVGAPVAGASVSLLGLDHPAGMVIARSDESGEFEIHGHSPGEYSVEATESTRSSDRVHLMLAEGVTAPRVRLVLEERRRLEGLVVSRGGGVPRALVLGFPFRADGTLAAMEAAQTTSSVDGSFSLELPRDSARVRLVVTSVGHPLAVVSVQVAGTTSAVVTLGAEHGSLELPLAPRDAEQPVFPLVLYGGEALDVPLLRQWAHATGSARQEGRVRIDAMPSGNYAYCELMPAEALLVFGGIAAPHSRACSEGFLVPGGVLSLDLGPSQ
jgi:hypothetical protein